MTARRSKRRSAGDGGGVEAPLTVGRLARRVGLSRSTLLYYDSIGLLCPSARSSSNYRLYTRRDRERLESICRYRAAGVPLEQIATLVDGGRARGAAAILERRLAQLDAEIARLRDQQRLVVRLLRDPSKLRRTRTLDKERWIEVLRASGMNDEDMRRWHVEFERMAPSAHGDFLEALGIAPEEVRRIRRWSQRQA